MQFTMEAVDKALDTLLPTMAKIRYEREINVNRPDLLKIAAYNFFLRGAKAELSFDETLCYYVVREAALELEKHGFFTWGTTNITLEKEQST